MIFFTSTNYTTVANNLTVFHKPKLAKCQNSILSYVTYMNYINLHKSLFNVFSSLIFSNSVISNPKLQYIAKYIKTKTIPTKLNYVGKKVRFCCHPEEKRVYKVGDRGGYIR